MKLETPGLGVEHRHPDNVRGQQVRGELHTLEIQAQGGGQGVGEGGLAQARQVFNQQVAVREQCHKRQAHFLRLAEHQGVDLCLGGVKGLSQVLR